MVAAEVVVAEALLSTVLLFSGHLNGRGRFGFGFLLFVCEGFGYLYGAEIKCLLINRFQLVGNFGIVSNWRSNVSCWTSFFL